jgi:hypothetical protein
MKYIQTSTEEQTKNKTNAQKNKASFISTFLQVFNTTMQVK